MDGPRFHTFPGHGMLQQLDRVPEGLRQRHGSQKEQARSAVLKAVIANVLIQAESSTSRGSRENAQTDEEPTANKRTKVIPLPPNEVRYNMTGHFPEHVKLKFQMKCRNPHCNRKSRVKVKCTKCHVFLCLQNGNCFLDFHKR
ncbi:unnamed protein product [Ixodes hexagonus]